MKQWFFFWTLGLIWGSSFLLIKVAVEEWGVLPLVSIRITLAACLMMLYLLAQKSVLPRKRADWLSIAFVGLANVAIPFTLITRAEELIDSSMATTLNASVPLFSLVIAHFALHDEKLTRQKVAGLLVGYLGILVLMSRGLLKGGQNSLAGLLMMVAAVASYAVAVVFMRARLRHIQPLTIAGLSLTSGALFILPLTLTSATLPRLAEVSTQAWAAVLVLATVNTVLAYFLFYHLIDRWGARATLVTYVFPPVGISLGALFLGEPVNALLILGACLILTGVVTVNYKPKRQTPTPLPVSA